MGKFKELYSKYITKETLTFLLFLLVIIQPILDLDYLLNDFLKHFHLIVPSTIIRFLFIPILGLLVYLVFDKNKKRTFAIGFSICLIYGIFFVLYVLSARNLDLYLPTTFVFTMGAEIKYYLTLLIPFILIYISFFVRIEKRYFNAIIIAYVLMISVPIFLSNLFVFGPSTYVGDTQANFLSWFNGIYDTYHPRQLASSFFFKEGNTTSILMFMITPLLYKVYYDSNKKLWLAPLLLIHGIAMYIIATRVATFGIVLMTIGVLGLWLFLVLIKKEKFNLTFLVTLVVLSGIFLGMFKFSPAYVNQQIDAENNSLVLDEDKQREEGKDALAGGANLVPGTAEFNYFYQHIFEDYIFLLTIPSIYYELWYPYEMDSKFWVDLIFEYPLEERVSGRHFQKIFSDYKFAMLTPKQKLFGMGYSRFMMGSIILEQDFKQQIYSYGYIGGPLLTGPWLVMIVALFFLILIKFNKLATFENGVLGMAIVGTLLAAYQSGHTLDQFLTTIPLAFLFGILIRNVYFGYKKETIN